MGPQALRQLRQPRFNEHPLPGKSAAILANPRTVRLAIPDLAPTHIIEITARLQDSTGAEVERVISGTIHRVPGSASR